MDNILIYLYIHCLFESMSDLFCMFIIIILIFGKYLNSNWVNSWKLFVLSDMENSMENN